MRAALRSEMLAPRYAGVPTFMRAPLVPRGALSSVDVGLFGVPFDGGVTNRPGARLGPRAGLVQPPASADETDHGNNCDASPPCPRGAAGLAAVLEMESPKYPAKLAATKNANAQF